MVKPSDISKLMGQNYWTWKEEAEALLRAEGLWNAIDPSVPMPGGIIQMRTWTNDNQKAYGILYLTLNPSVKSKVNNTGVGKGGCLLWAQLSSFYTTSDPATRSMLMAQLNDLSHDIMEPADDFLQAIVTAESRLTTIAVSLPLFMIWDKFLGGLSSVYSSITTVFQNKLPQCSVPDMITVINTWEFADLQKHDSVIKAACTAFRQNHGGEDLDPYTPSAFTACHDHSCRSNQTSAPSHSAGGNEFDWMNTKNRLDVCHRCGIPSHFTQYCVSIMPDEVRRQIIRNREHQAHLAEDESSDNDLEGAHIAATAIDTNLHFTLATHDLPSNINLDTMDPMNRESFATVYVVPYPAHNFDVDPQPTPLSPTLTTSTLSIAGTPTKKKGKKKKKKKSATVEDVQVAMRELSLKEEEAEFSM
ncbi:hypothetical protein B0H10DRAFT_1939613 [Mycena sp. CBHHK59/15]|nr:hypothetical protein B0H10DRAFT_1939613 [Mycena sp. CBHHK59/15]